MIFGALSNAAYRVSLHGPGAELDAAGVQTPPAARRVRSRAAARRGINIKNAYLLGSGEHRLNTIDLNFG